MRSILTIVDAANGLSLLSEEERRVAAGLASDDDSQDDALAAMDLRAAAAICDECNVAVGTGNEPTLLRETVSEAFRRVYGSQIALGRRHDIAITSVTEDDVLLAAADYEVDPESGLLDRLSGTYARGWAARTVVVVYAAGFDEAPQALKNAAIETMTAMWRDAGRDPYVKGTTVEVPDVETVRTDMWSGSLPGQMEGSVPPGADVHLKRFRNMAIG